MQEQTKDYAKLYKDDIAPVPQTRRSTKALDGAPVPRRHREANMGIDPMELHSALRNLPQANNYAMLTLNQHFNEVFPKKTYKVYIIYMENGKEDGETYLVRIDRNNLRAVKEKMPIKGNFRLFFSINDKQFEEVEDDEAPLPCIERDGSRIIRCRVFKLRY